MRRASAPSTRRTASCKTCRRTPHAPCSPSWATRPCSAGCRCGSSRRGTGPNAWRRQGSSVSSSRIAWGGKTSRRFLAEVLARLTLSAIDTSEARQLRRSSIRYGTVGVRGETEQGAEVPTATIRYSLGEEADTVRWFQDEVKTRGVLPLTEAEAVVSSLSLAMHGSRHILIPLLQLKEFDQYTTTHSMNVAVLAMALAEFLGLGARDVRNFGIAGLLHDIGKVRIPLEILTKPGRFTERSEEHTSELQSQSNLVCRLLLEKKKNY